jgi:hypothetical protein
MRVAFALLAAALCAGGALAQISTMPSIDLQSKGADDLRLLDKCTDDDCPLFKCFELECRSPVKGDKVGGLRLRSFDACTCS